MGNISSWSDAIPTKQLTLQDNINMRIDILKSVEVE